MRHSDGTDGDVERTTMDRTADDHTADDHTDGDHTDDDHTADGDDVGARGGSVAPAVATPIALVIAVAIIALLVALERRFPLRYDSDDVAWQIALRSWRPGGSTLVMPENTYLLHVPLLVLGDRALPASPWTLTTVSWALNLVGLAMIVWVAEQAVASYLGTTRDRLGWRPRAVTVSSIAVVVLTSPDQRWVMAGLTSRNLEIGIGLLVIHQLTAAWTAREAVTARRAAMGIVALSLIGIDDPLLMYSIVIPAVVAATAVVVIARLRNRGPDPATRAAAVGITVVGLGGLIGWQLVRWLLDVLGVRQLGSGNEVVGPVSALGHLDELVDVFGMITSADMIADGVWFRTVGGIMAVALPIAALVVLVRHRPVPLLVWTILAWPVILSLLYIGTSAGSDPDTVRYVAVGYPAVGVALAVAATRVPLLRTMVVGFALFTTVVAAATLLDRRGTEGNGTYQLALRLQELADDGGPTFGYSGYWTAHIVTYYAGDPPTVLAMHCDADGRTAPFEWITDLGRFDHDAVPTSFIIVDTSERAFACPPDLLVAQHGAPVQVIDLDDDTEIWIYDGDVTTVPE